MCEFPNTANKGGHADDKRGHTQGDAEEYDFVSAPVCADSMDQSGDASNDTSSPSSVTTNCFRFVQSQRSHNDSHQFCQESFNASLANFLALMQNESLIIDKMEVILRISLCLSYSMYSST